MYNRFTFFEIITRIHSKTISAEKTTQLTNNTKIHIFAQTDRSMHTFKSFVTYLQSVTVDERLINSNNVHQWCQFINMIAEYGIQNIFHCFRKSNVSTVSIQNSKIPKLILQLKYVVHLLKNGNKVRSLWARNMCYICLLRDAKIEKNPNFYLFYCSK